MSAIHTVLMGIGNPRQGDDGVGPWLADRLQAPGWLSLNCDTVPENFTAVVRRHTPARLVLVDAADMRLPAGATRRIPPEHLRAAGLGTHQAALQCLVNYLRDAAGEIIFIGIQPASLYDGQELSVVARTAAEQVLELARTNRLYEIPAWEPVPR